MKSVSDLLNEIRQRSTSVAQKGFLFEKLMKVALQQHPEYSDRFSNIYLWKEWPSRDGVDIGIDIVAQETEEYGGGLCAIQCKFYDTGTIPNSEIDKFLAAAGTKFTSKILIATSNYSQASQRKLLNNNASVITYNDLSYWIIEEDALDLGKPDSLKLKQIKFKPRYHQLKALEKVKEWFTTSQPRGRLLLPCGTGKSLTALWLAENNVGNGGRILYLVPSISLMSQTMKAWAGQKSLIHRYVGVCSDVKTGRGENEDSDLTELSIPVTTDSYKITQILKEKHPNALTVVFSTYQSLAKICEAQDNGVPKFDLVICDEAHRTTGVEKTKNSENNFLLVHNQEKLRADRRLYMTATQRIYEPTAKLKAGDKNLDVYSMDDEKIYGSIIYEMKFGEAVINNLLTDYKVVVIAYDADKEVDSHNQYVIQSGKDNIKTEDWVTLIGLWDALASPETEAHISDRPAGIINDNHCRQGLVFTSSIKKSENIAEHWPNIIKTVANNLADDYDKKQLLNLEVEHIDGKMNAFERHRKLAWLKKKPDNNKARLITNARCLSEGVDVPSLDAVLFMTPKKSKIDIIQSVGRVMRKAENKKVGYIILPIVVPHNQIAYSHEHLNSSEFNTVWEVLRALRSHDERLDTRVNSIHLASKIPVKFVDRTKSASKRSGVDFIGDNPQMSLIPTEAIASAIVNKVGDRQYWPTWGRRVGQISHNLENRIADLTENNTSVQRAYNKFSKEIEDTLKTKIETRYLSAMVAQHVVTAPVFDALFGEDEFSAKNPISLAIDNFLNKINHILNQENSLVIETEELTKFYKTIKRQISQIDNPLARLEILKNLYESFFQYAMPEVTTQLGVVYTPNPIVDFMIRFVNSICQDNFKKTSGISEKGVNILDPFTGTGTFIYRLLTITDENENYLIHQKDLRRKFEKELHAKEILLLAYYIANLKIEEGYRERQLENQEYIEFRGATFTDAFKSVKSKQESLDFKYLKQNDERVKEQNQIPIQIIIGNPPWSSGQDSAHENNTNIEYPELQLRVKETYVKKQREISKRPLGGNSMGNLFIKAIRWASDWVDDNKADNSSYGSIIAFVHPNSLTDGTSLAGARASLMNEFTDIYVINLRGNAYKYGEEFKREGDKLFGSGSRNGVQITFLVRNPERDINKLANLHYAEVPDSCTRQEKFDWLSEINGIFSDKFNNVTTDKKFNWINIGDGSYEKLMPICADKYNKKAVVANHAPGVTTGLDYYVYAFNKEELIKRIQKLINAYNTALDKYLSGENDINKVTANHDQRIIKWTETLKRSLKLGHRLIFDETNIRQVLYRPFVKMWLYADYRILSRMKIISKMLPENEYQQSIINPSSPDNDVSNLFSKQAITPPPRTLFSSQQTTTEQSSEPCPAPQSPISAQSAQINRPKQSSDNDQYSASICNINIRYTNQSRNPRSSSFRRRNENNYKTTPVNHTNILFHKNKQVPFGVLTSNTIVDLCVTGRDTKVVMYCQ